MQHFYCLIQCASLSQLVVFWGMAAATAAAAVVAANIIVVIVTICFPSENVRQRPFSDRQYFPSNKLLTVSQAPALMV